MMSETPPPGRGRPAGACFRSPAAARSDSRARASGYAVGTTESSQAATVEGALPFYGAHQAGILTPPQDRLMFAAFDLTITTADELRDLLRSWSQSAALMTAGPAGRVARRRRSTRRRPTPGRRWGCPHPGSRSPSDWGRACFSRTATTGSAWRPSGPRRCLRSASSPVTSCCRTAATATCACRPAPRIRRWRFTPSATWPAAPAGRR